MSEHNSETSTRQRQEDELEVVKVQICLLFCFVHK